MIEVVATQNRQKEKSTSEYCELSLSRALVGGIRWIRAYDHERFIRRSKAPCLSELSSNVVMVVVLSARLIPQSKHSSPPIPYCFMIIGVCQDGCTPCIEAQAMS